MAKMQNVIDDYLNSLNEAMAIHAKKATENLSFNKTELVEIVDITNRDKGWYIVWNGSTKYQVYSENKTYKIGTKVYVDIPNNDYSGQKIIKGLYSNGTTVSDYTYTYDLPLDSISVYGENLLATINQNEYGLLANYDKINKIDGSQYLEIANIDSITTGYRYLGLAADFKTLLPEITDGTYGILLTAELEDGREEIFTLDTSDMVGNLYSFPSYTQQQKIFDISNFNIKSLKIEFYQMGNFYNGEDRFNGVISAENNLFLPDNILVKNLQLYYGDFKKSEKNSLKLVSDSLIYNSAMGEGRTSRKVDLEWWYTDIDTPGKKPVKIESYDSIPEEMEHPRLLWYKYIDPEIASKVQLDIQQIVETKKNKLAFIKENFPMIEEERVFIDAVLEEEIFNKFVEDIFEYVRVQTVDGIETDLYIERTKTITKAGWKYIQTKESDFIKENRDDEKYLELYSNNEGWYLIDDEEKLFSRIVTLDLNKKETKFKVYLEYGPWASEVDRWEQEHEIEGVYNKNSSKYGYLESEIIIFTNEAEIEEDLEKRQKSLKIICEDGSEGIYNIYDGTSGAILDSNESLKFKEFSLSFEPLEGITGITSILDTDWIIWEFPMTSTMINVDESCYEKEDRIDGTNEIFSLYKGKISYDSSKIYIKHTGKNIKQKYKLASKFLRTAVNNTVKCYLIQDKGILITELEMQFGQFSYTGSDYTFSLSLGSLYIKDGNTYIKSNEEVDNFIRVPMDENTYREIEIKLFDIKGKEVILTSEEKNDIINLWIEGNEDGYYSGYANKDNLEFISFEDNGVLKVGIRPLVDADDMCEIQMAETVSSVPASLEKFSFIILQAEYKKEKYKENGFIEDVVAYNQILPLNFKIWHIDPSNPYLERKNLFIQGPNYVVYDHIGGNPKTNPEYSSYSALSIHAEERKRGEKSYIKDIKKITANLNKLSILNYGSEEEHEIDNKNYSQWYEQYENRKKTYSSWLKKLEKEENLNTGTNDSYQTYGFLKIEDDNAHDNYPQLSSEGALLLKREYIDGLSKNICYILKQKTYTSEDGDPIEVELCTMPFAILKNRFSVCGKNVWVHNIQLFSKNAEPTINSFMLGSNPLISSSGQIIDAATNVTHVENDGTLSSVLIGSVIDENQAEKTGLFGYHEGNPIFAVKTDGTAFLGKIGQGRIYFDGNGGVITSNAAETSNYTKGTIINLKNSEIDLKSNKGDESWVHIGANSADLVTDADKDIVYFSVNEKEGNRLISIGDIDTVLERYTTTTGDHRKNDIDYQNSNWGNFFIKTKDFERPSENSEGAGLRIDLSTGNFESYSDFTIMSSDFITFDGKTQITDTLDIFSNTSINGRLDIAGSLNFISYEQNNAGNYYRIAIDADNGVYRYVFIDSDADLAQKKIDGLLNPSLRYNQLLNEVKTDSNQNLVIKSADLSDLGSLDLTIFSNCGSPTADAQNPVIDNIFIQRKDLNSALENYTTTDNIPSLIEVSADLNTGTKIARIKDVDIYAPSPTPPTDLSNYYSKVEINRLIYALKQAGVLANNWDINTPIPGE